MGTLISLDEDGDDDDDDEEEKEVAEGNMVEFVQTF
jgi:hypothetical protein